MEFITIGKVANAHGVRGDLKIFPTTDDINRFIGLKKVYLEHMGKVSELTILSVKFNKNLVLLQVKEFDTKEEAVAIRNASIMVPMEEAVELGENENFIFQILGLEAREEDGTVQGKVIDVLQSGGHDVYVIDDGSKNGLMIPATLAFVPEVNVEEGYMTIRVIEGLKDL